MKNSVCVIVEVMAKFNAVKTKKPSRIILLIVSVLILAVLGFIGVRSGVLKLNFSVNKNNQQKSYKMPPSTILQPSGWEKIKADTSIGEIARFESKEIDTEQKDGGSFTTNAVIKVRVAAQYKSLDDFFNTYKATAVNGAPEKQFQIIAASPIEVNGSKGYLLETIFYTEIKSKNIRVHQLDYLFYKDGVSFLIEGYSSNDSWSKHEAEIRTALQSFRFK
ncbi:MAG: hypothetical protein HZA34_01895 [Candidatus Pacebacteria bacterium]|nr:hypothetical protein [Candidatus Paceibacterota bacterium]